MLKILLFLTLAGSGFAQCRATFDPILGLLTCPPATATARGTVNLQTGTTYTVLSSDCGNYIQHKNASSIAYTLPQATGAFTTGCIISVLNLGSGTLTITPTTSTIVTGTGSAAATAVLVPMQTGAYASDGTNWQVVGSGFGYDAQTATYSFPTNTLVNMTGASGQLSVGGNGIASGGAITGASLSVTSGLITAGKYQTNSVCASSASPAACVAASAGSVVVAAGATTVQVNTTIVGSFSQIFLMFDSSLGTRLSVTCNTTEPALFGVTARNPGTSFTITSSSPSVNPACFSYLIVN